MTFRGWRWEVYPLVLSWWTMNKRVKSDSCEQPRRILHWGTQGQSERARERERNEGRRGRSLALALSIYISIWWSTCRCKSQYYYKTVARLRAARRGGGVGVRSDLLSTEPSSIKSAGPSQGWGLWHPAQAPSSLFLVDGWILGQSYSAVYHCLSRVGFFEALAQIWENKILPVTLVLTDAVTWFLFSWAEAADPCLYAKRWFVNMKQCVNY